MRPVFCVRMSTPIWSLPSVSGSANSDSICNSSITLRALINSGEFPASPMVTVPRATTRSWRVSTRLTSADALAGIMPSM